MDRDDGWLGRALMVVAVVFGLSTAGNLVTRGGAAGPAASVPLVGDAGPPSAEPTRAAALAPSGFTRPLAMIADFLSARPMFEFDEQDRLRLVEPYASAPGCATAAPGVAADCERALLDRVAALAREQRVGVRFVIATLPDWVDSSLQWTFDPMLDAIQMAAAQVGYLPSAHYLPDAELASGSGSARARLRRAHESEPGALLFRRSSAGTTDLLLVLLVGETATAGVHAPALATALDLVLRWERGAADAPLAAPLRILSPTYSGSAESLRRGLLAAVARHPGAAPPTGPWFQLISPSATRPDNAQTLAIDGIASFGATVRSDDESMHALAEYLGRSDPAWRCGKRVALLVEANTTWGRRFFEQRNTSASLAPAGPAGRPGRSGSDCQRCTDGGLTADLAPPYLPCATVLPFPMHISRLRSEAAQRARAPANAVVPTDSATVGLALGDSGAAVDRPPSFSPTLTAANVETMLNGVFRAIEERNITAIGVLATDKRDHVFLAQEIVRRTPDVLPFTLESNLIYLHPDVSSFVRGTLVASTYSLYDRTQFLTRPTLANHFRQQFGSAAAHGVFNALSALLDEPAQMLDYEVPAGPGARVPPRGGDGPCRPGAQACRPPVWISVAARGALLPLTAAPPASYRDDQYAWPAPNTPESPLVRTQQDYLGKHGLFRALLVLAAGLLIWHRRPRRDAVLPDYRDPRLESEWRASRFACDAALLALGLWLLKLLAISTADSRAFSPELAQPWFLAVCAAAGSWMLWRALRAFWPTASARSFASRGAVLLVIAAVLFWCLAPTSRERALALQLAALAGLLAVLLDLDPRATRDGAPDLWSVQRWRRVPVLFGLAAATCLLVDLALRHWDPVEAVLYADRTGLLKSLASPAPAIVLLCGATYWWGAWNLRRLQLMWLPEVQVGIGVLLEGRTNRLGPAMAAVFQQPTLSVGTFFLLPVLGAAYALLAGAGKSGTLDGHAFGGFLWLGAACAIAMFGHTLAHTLHLGNTLLGTLRALGRHPAATVFETLGKEAFPWRLSFTEARVPEFEPLIRRVQLAAAGARRWTAEDQQRLVALQVPEREAWLAQADELVLGMKFDRSDPATAGPVRLADWQRLDALTRQFKNVLRVTRWRAGFEVRELSPALADSTTHMEYVVLFHAAVILRDLLTRLLSGFTAVLGGLTLLLGAHLFYTFQGRAFWLTLDWVAIAIVALAGVRILVRLERDHVLSRLWGTTPGRISAFGGLSWRMVLYLVVTLVALFGAFFPEVAGDALKWLEPARRLIP
jgi:hypothetical protein